jgi:hypothetical protein
VFTPDSCSSPFSTSSLAGGALQQRINSDEARKLNHWPAAGGEDDEMNKDSFVLLASLFVVMIENIDTPQAAGWRWDVGEGLSPVDKVFRDLASPGGFGQPDQH